MSFWCTCNLFCRLCFFWCFSERAIVRFSSLQLQLSTIESNSKRYTWHRLDTVAMAILSRSCSHGWKGKMTLHGVLVPDMFLYAHHILCPGVSSSLISVCNGILQLKEACLTTYFVYRVLSGRIGVKLLVCVYSCIYGNHSKGRKNWMTFLLLCVSIFINAFMGSKSSSYNYKKQKNKNINRALISSLHL